MSKASKKPRVPRMENIMPIPLQDELLVDLVDKAKDWALMHGACMRSKTNFDRDALQFAPFILLPSPFPRSEFEKAVAIQPILNELMHYVAYDTEFLKDSLKDTIEVDPFTRRLFQIMETIEDEGINQNHSLGLLRSDYMLHTDCCDRIKQVEINSIASSFGGISSVLSDFYRFVLEELGHYDKLKNLPENNALSGLCNGMIEAYNIYNQKDSVILFVVEDITYNICDQRFHEFEIRKLNPDIRVIRKTLTEIAQSGKLGQKNELIIDGKYEIAVIYFRAGYEPGHYPTEEEWNARLIMERSMAIKCPSIHYHLAGTKKVQQALAKSNVLSRFLKDPKKVEVVKEIFTGLYSLDLDKYGNDAVEMALKDPERFVLKPQREGGGNNVYGIAVRDTLLKMQDSKERTAWILMERINPPLISNYMIRPGGSSKPELCDLVSELGIFGVIIGDRKEIKVNKQVGHMLRTKKSTSNEGGVAAGLGALDSPYLVD